MPRASIVIPTHKRLRMLEEAVGSAQAQTVSDIEIIVVIDGDDPETAGYVSSLEDVRVRLLWDGLKRGEAKNTARGIAAVESPYFGILHDDDIWESNLLERLIPSIEAEPDAAVVFGDHWIIDGTGVIDEKRSADNSSRYGRSELTNGTYRPFYRGALLKRTLPAVMTSLYRTSKIDLTDMPDLPANFDYWLGWAAVRGGRPVVYVDERLSRYRVHAASGTARAQKAWADAAVLLNSILAQEPELQELRGDFMFRLADSYRRRARLRQLTREPGAFGDVLLALRTRPGLPIIARCLLLIPSAVRGRVRR